MYLSEQWTIRKLDFENTSNWEGMEALLAARISNMNFDIILYGVFAEEDSLVGILGGTDPETLQRFISDAIIQKE